MGFSIKRFVLLFGFYLNFQYILFSYFYFFLFKLPYFQSPLSCLAVYLLYYIYAYFKGVLKYGPSVVCHCII